MKKQNKRFYYGNPAGFEIEVVQGHAYWVTFVWCPYLVLLGVLLQWCRHGDPRTMGSRFDRAAC
jgi:hypothetical protein